MPSISYEEVRGPLSEENLAALTHISQSVFADEGQAIAQFELQQEMLRANLSGHTWVHVALAYADEKVVGYKVGRSNDPRTFESWSGGVIPEFRRRGIAGQLAHIQESWCRENGFLYLMTLTAFDNQAMLIVNLKRGFHIAGTHLDRGTHLKVMLQKSLSPS